MPPPPPPVSRSKQPVWITLLLLIVGAAAAWLRPTSDDAVPVSRPPDAARVESPNVVALPRPVRPPTNADADDGSLARAIAARSPEAVVVGSGRVVKLLLDDNDGLRHQKLLIAVAGGGTILIAHNIDLAPRIAARVGDTIVFKGIYVWTDRGGVVHWTHRDPAGRHPAGWTKVNGVTVQ